MISTEKRQKVRRGLTIYANLLFDGGRELEGMQTMDISSTGARFRTMYSRSVGEAVMLRPCDTYNNFPLECKGRISWVNLTPDGYCHFGVRFVDLSCDEQEQLNAFLEEKSREKRPTFKPVFLQVAS